MAKNFDAICEEIREKIKKEADKICGALKEDIDFDRMDSSLGEEATIAVKAITRLILDHSTTLILKRNHGPKKETS